MKNWMIGALALGVALTVHATEFYVDRTTGDDLAAGSADAPFRTLTRAAKALQAGDTLHVRPGETAWRETLNLYGLTGGEPDQPIVIDGHGAWLTGADPCPAEGWTAQPNGTWMHRGMDYKNCLVVGGELRLETIGYEVLQPGELCYLPTQYNRLFMRVTGKTPPAVEVGQPEGASVVLDPALWQFSGMAGILRYNGLQAPSWVKVDGVDVALVEARDRLKDGQFCVADRTLYFHPPAGQSPADMAIEAVVRDNGVQFGGNTHDVILRNFNVRNVSNDAYNLHNAVKRISFYNCNARDCGDEGFSSHDDCDSLLDGAVYVNCDNGINNVGRATSISRNVVLARSRHNGYEGQQQSVHVLENAILVDNPVQLAAGSATLTATNVLIVRTAKGPEKTTALAGEGRVALANATVVGNTQLARLLGKVSYSIRDSIVAENQGLAHVRVDDPRAALQISGTTVGPGMTLEWNSKYPFQQAPLADWLAGNSGAAIASIVTLDATDLPPLTEGKVVRATERGCSQALLDRYAAFMAE